ncbi:hypothetical protein HMPREF9333_01739 [Johnsonella ignava ATCC 51276]|uniref:Uncharacterized protein n=1 Tax=Johnsonella ignava ATCC 51276 TaxID=679200 RepID=G5GJJ9_9FIRM|nr:N-acetylmuramoyl-L-alanine amidase family protein [Johnsonella ignava]EHI55119.1 hypothetical protein HMPREF9333_01739 [Johnsonella ignava ATCC 51276]
MKHIKAIFGISFVISCLFASKAYANIKTITEVNFKVHHELEAGLFLENLAVDTSSPKGGDINVYVKSKQYSLGVIEKTNSGKNKTGIGDKLRIKVSASPSGGSNGYQFRGNYSKDNVKVTGADVISVEKKGSNLEIVVELRPVKGTYEPPKEVELVDGQNAIGRGRWKNPEDSSGYYDITLYRGESPVFSVEDHQGESFNFYPYMTAEGTYKYRVRTVPHTQEQKEVGKKSEWVMSDEYYIDKNHISDGSGKANAATAQNDGKVGWIKEDVYWYYKFPNGNLKTNGWEYINGKWYLFNATGIMLTGWQKYNAKTYYMNPEGDMRTGWFYDEGRWYYLSTDEKEKEGQLVMKAWIKAPENKTYYMNADGAMAQGWLEIGNKWYYFYPDTGQMAYNTRVDTFYLDADGVWIKNKSR